MKEFNGHRSWNAWNVSLWISNDEGLYNFAISCITDPVVRNNKISKPSLNMTVRRFMREFEGQKTPDGARYSRIAVRLALAGLIE